MENSVFMKPESFPPFAASAIPAGEQQTVSELPAVHAVKSVCVYCGSSSRGRPAYTAHAAELGKRLGEGGFKLVYGGGRVGLMGTVADAALQAGGKVIGIIPQHIQALEVEHHGLTELHIVDSMHTRKRMMAERSDAYVVLPGGFGTLDETFEIVTWKKLGLHNKPIILLDDGGFWQPLIKLLDHIVAEGFALPRDRQLVQVAGSLDEVMQLLRAQGSSKIHSQLI
ncbi:MAG TPA: TIGR00730 family Rossman fold protein [Alphaproteobacteria bacterium]|nr:TIGR00730 family Rossman fold protein [Alphaproteobacteria bacterium]